MDVLGIKLKLTIVHLDTISDNGLDIVTHLQSQLLDHIFEDHRLAL